MRKAMQRGFTLVELMIVVAIIGILASVAIPAYEEYITRSQVSEALSLLSSGKTPFGEYFADKGVWPAISDAMGNTSGKYTASITITGTPVATGTAPSITLMATMRSSGVNSNITNGTVLLRTMDSGKNWTCIAGGATPIDNRYLPAACRG